MHSLLSVVDAPLAVTFDVPVVLYNAIQIIKVLIGFSIIIFVHELGHFMAAKYVGVRVDRFAVGFGYRLCGWRRNEGFTFGNRPNYTADQLAEKDYGETDYCFKALPFGGYVKMLGQDDIQIDEKSGEITMTDDPRAFTNRTVGQRMFIVSAGVIMNVIFAALAFMTVFLIGKEMLAPVIGVVVPDSPADKAGLQPGDEIASIDGKKPNSFVDIIIAHVLADGSLEFRVKRGGVLLDNPFRITPEWNDELGMRIIGIGPLTTTVLDSDGGGLLEGDKIISVDGMPVKSLTQLVSAVTHSRGGTAVITIERRDPANPNAPPQQITVTQSCRLLIGPTAPRGDNPERSIDSRHLLGWRARWMVTMVTPKGPAGRAGFKTGDVIVRWDGVNNPNFADIIASIQAKDGQDIVVLVERDGASAELTVRPRRPFGLFRKTKPEVGLGFAMAYSTKPVVAEITPDTSAAALNMPRGSLLKSIDGEPVDNWFAVVDAVKARAGRRVEIEFQTGERTVRSFMTIPSSVTNELGLPPDATIRSIDGENSVKIAADDGSGAADGREYHLPSTIAVREILKKKIGSTVRIEYYSVVTGETTEADFEVRADNFDPWQLRIRYAFDISNRFKQLKYTARASNPIAALGMGVDYTWSKLVEVYMSIKQLAKRNIGVKNISGPVGIISRAVDLAKESFVELLFFLAFLSVNLAVINLMPLPVLDGGLMVFLLIEKIKGKPLSIKTQMVSTIVGLALIVICFLFVTIQDIARFF